MNRHANRMRLERLPDDPPIPLEESIQNPQSIPSFVDLRLWAAWTPGQDEIAALGNVSLLRVEENRHLSSFDISVLAEHRRQGLGRQMLRRIAEAAAADQRRLLMTSTNDRVPAGEAFMLRMGAQKGLEAHTNQLKIEALDRELVARWLGQGQQNLADFELGLWDGPYPEGHIQDVSELYDLVNQQPLGVLELERERYTPEHIREMEHNLFARGNQRWTYYLVERATAKFAGYSETVWNPNRPEQLRQDMTGVFPQYRGKGLGRWLKAAMLDKVLRERPQVKFVRTGNADSNAAMLKINTELGFEPYIAEALWQVELDQVREYLGS
jgi:GNAT superfamily N-acetyltransferase